MLHFRVHVLHFRLKIGFKLISCSQVHFLPIVSTIESEGIDRFASLNDDIKGQIGYVYDVINGNPDLKDITKVLADNQSARAESILDKAEESKMLRDRGNKAYAKKEFQVFSHSQRKCI